MFLLPEKIQEQVYQVEKKAGQTKEILVEMVVVSCLIQEIRLNVIIIKRAHQ